MPKRTYNMEFQRLQPSRGYVPCEPHQASRCVVIETTSVPARLGRRGYHTKRIVANFSGSAMRLNAQAELDRLTRGTRPRPTFRLPAWGRSCTLVEYNSIMKGKGRG